MCKKLLLQELKVHGSPHPPTPYCSKAVPPLSPRKAGSQSGWFLSHCAPGRDVPQPRTQIKKVTKDTGHRSQAENHCSTVSGWKGVRGIADCGFHLMNLFPEFQIPPLPFVLLMKRLA